MYRTSERLRLRTEGSNRWEKCVDPYLAEQAAMLVFFFMQKTAYEITASDWSSDVCSSDLDGVDDDEPLGGDARLAAVHDPRLDRRLDRPLDVGAGEHQERVAASQLQDHLLDVL